MKVATYSGFLFKKEGKDWHRSGTNVEYSSNGTFHNGMALFSLGWDYGFEEAGHWTYFAYSYPYSYTHLKQQIKNIKNNEGKSDPTLQI